MKKLVITEEEKKNILEQYSELNISDVSRSVNEKKEVSYDDIEKLTEEVQEFIKSKGFDIMDEFEFLTRLEKVLYEGIDKHNG